MALNDNLAHPEVIKANQRLGIGRDRKPFTPEDFESYRPKPAASVNDEDAVPAQDELAALLGGLAGPFAAPRLKLARYIFLLEQRVASLERLEQRVASLEEAVRDAGLPLKS